MIQRRTRQDFGNIERRNRFEALGDVDDPEKNTT